MTAPTRLRAEHLSEAMGLTIREPRLSWTPPAGTVRQIAYRITAGNGWDTGKVESAASGAIPYSGPGLDSRSRFEWRVRTWNIGHTGTETASSWSEPMPVELGLLHASDWTAGWIGPGEEEVPVPGERPGCALTKDFRLDAAPEKARVYATAHGIYELFINGRRVGDQQLTPGSTSYNTTLQVQAYDVTGLLREEPTPSGPSSPMAGTAAASATRATPACTVRTQPSWRSWRRSPWQAGRSSAPTARGWCPQRRSSVPTSWRASALIFERPTA
ncbi:hypothetical protein QF050_000397 [Arthrobacter sp. SLBN-112]|nr:hypothetical protein [Arthrobacter sp. SLBN-112]